MYGTGFIMDKLGELKIKISPLSFYQVNNFVKIFTIPHAPHACKEKTELTKVYVYNT